MSSSDREKIHYELLEALYTARRRVEAIEAALTHNAAFLGAGVEREHQIGRAAPQAPGVSGALMRYLELVEPGADISDFIGREGHDESRPRLGTDAPEEIRPDKTPEVSPLVRQLALGHPDDAIAFAVSPAAAAAAPSALSSRAGVQDDPPASPACSGHRPAAAPQGLGTAEATPPFALAGAVAPVTARDPAGSLTPVRHSISGFAALLGLGGGSAAPASKAASPRRPSTPGPHLPLLPLLDARSPSEYRQGHIPGALSLPLFSDEERASVGTLYKKRDRETAVLHGLACVGPRLEDLARRLLEAAGPEREMAVYCSRGGMRSASLAWLCGLLGIQAHVAEGGYKAFRRHVLRCFEERHNLLVLGGETGSGKTEVLRHIAGLGAQVVDLEGLARHRGSAFGSMPGSPQPSSEHFENRLAIALAQCDPAAPVWVEDECENLGSVNLPRSFFRQLRAAPLLVLRMSRQARLARVLAEYGDMPPEEMAACLDRIQKRLGGLEHKKGRACIENGDLPGVAAILLDYYDRAYAKQLRDRRLIGVVEPVSAQDAALLLLRAAKAACENLSETEGCV